MSGAPNLAGWRIGHASGKHISAGGVGDGRTFGGVFCVFATIMVGLFAVTLSGEIWLLKLISVLEVSATEDR